MSQIEKLTPPYFAVIFPNQLASDQPEGYAAMANRMCELAAQQPGYLGIESTRNSEGFGITISYWQDMESIANWKKVSEHMEAQKLGQSTWYKEYRVRICKVEREYGWPTT